MELKIFNKAVGMVFDNPLMTAGFKLHDQKIEKHSCQRVYISGDKHISISADVNSLKIGRAHV